MEPYFCEAEETGSLQTTVKWVGLPYTSPTFEETAVGRSAITDPPANGASGTSSVAPTATSHVDNAGRDFDDYNWYVRVNANGQNRDILCTRIDSTTGFPVGTVFPEVTPTDAIAFPQAMGVALAFFIAITLIGMFRYRG